MCDGLCMSVLESSARRTSLWMSVYLGVSLAAKFVAWDIMADTILGTFLLVQIFKGRIPGGSGNDK